MKFSELGLKAEILKALSEGPVGFADLKKKLDI
jgi:hypothetical protein